MTNQQGDESPSTERSTEQDPGSPSDVDPLWNTPVVLLSIKPEHAEALLDGEKHYEYRRTSPVLDPPYRAVLYATADVQAVVGGFETHTVLEAPPDRLVAQTVEATPQEPEGVRDYFAGKDIGSAIRVDRRLRYDEPVALDDLRGTDVEFHPPQNFRYLQPDDHAQLLQQLPYPRGIPHERQHESV